jgi:hypothetical protein
MKLPALHVARILYTELNTEPHNVVEILKKIVFVNSLPEAPGSSDAPKKKDFWFDEIPQWLAHFTRNLESLKAKLEEVQGVCPISIQELIVCIDIIGAAGSNDGGTEDNPDANDMQVDQEHSDASDMRVDQNQTGKGKRKLDSEASPSNRQKQKTGDSAPGESAAGDSAPMQIDSDVTVKIDKEMYDLCEGKVSVPSGSYRFHPDNDSLGRISNSEVMPSKGIANVDSEGRCTFKLKP